jgi:hypothetical protein
LYSPRHNRYSTCYSMFSVKKLFRGEWISFQPHLIC